MGNKDTILLSKRDSIYSTYYYVVTPLSSLTGRWKIELNDDKRDLYIECRYRECQDVRVGGFWPFTKYKRVCEDHTTWLHEDELKIKETYLNECTCNDNPN